MEYDGRVPQVELSSMSSGKVACTSVTSSLSVLLQATMMPSGVDVEP